MRLLQINTTATGAAPAAVACSIALATDAAGGESLLCYGRGPQPGASVNAVRFGTPMGVAAHGLRTRLLDGHGLGSKAATLELLRIIERYQPTHIHLHNLHGYYLHYPTLGGYLRHCGLPITWTMHDCWAMTGHCAYPSEHSCDRWMTGCHKCPARRTYPGSWLLDASATNHRTKIVAFSDIPQMEIHAVSHWLSAQLERSYLSQYPITVHHPDADPRIFSPAPGRQAIRRQLGVADSEKLILGVANFAEPRKGFRDFLALRDIMPEGWKFLMVGLTSQQLHSLPEGIVGSPRIRSTEQLRQMYTAADILFHPTRADTYSMTIREAALCGTPSVVYDTCGAHEALVPGLGAAVSPTPAAAAKAILVITDNKSIL